LKGAVQSDLSNDEKAELIQKESVEIYRELASINPLAFNSGLAYSLNNLAYTQRILNKPDLAERNSQEAIRLLL